MNITGSTRHPGGLAEEVRSLGPWFHNLHLPGGVQTCPNHFLGDFPRFKWQQLASHLPERLDGWTALDIGCNAGFYSFEVARRGAKVTGIDVDPRYLRQARWASHQLGLSAQVDFRQMHIYELARETRKYDLVLFMGVFYHLRYPMLALDTVSRLVGKLLVFQTMSMPGRHEEQTPLNLALDERQRLRRSGWPKMAFIERHLNGDPTNWWAPNHACIKALLRSTGQRVMTEPAEEIYLCEPTNDEPSSFWAWNAQEYMAAAQADMKRCR